MSTVTPPRPTIRPAPALRARLQQPLTRLLSAIRRYVQLETLALVVIACFLWALFCLVFDWAIFFKLFGFDYVREGTTVIQSILRTGTMLLLAGALGWIIYRFLIVRMLKPITTSDLAMALERKFPGQLGDRLVTAVELNDWERAGQQGYSSKMIEATTAEAEQALSAISVDEVLNRPRLRRRLMIAGGCLIATVAALLFVPEVAATWLERGVLARNVPWPRATILELTDFHDRAKAVPFGTEMKVTVRSAKWAVADPKVSEGWRPLLPADLQQNNNSWELADLTGVAELLAVLPADWQKLTFDQIETRLSEATPALQRELGLSLIRKLQDYYWEHRQDGASLPASLSNYLPEKLKAATIAEQKVALAVSAALPSSEAGKILQGLTTLRPSTGDLVLSLGNLAQFPAPSPLPPFSALQKIAYDRDRNIAPFAMPESEKQLLPEAWQKLAIRDLANQLKLYAAEGSAESLGQRVMAEGKHFFADLAQRASRTRFARRKSFRELTVPEKITLEFENTVESDDRNRGRVKRGTPELKRVNGTNDFQYDFKKLERAMRLRASVGSIVTPWHRVDVKPLPTLKQLVRWHDEPAYLYGSNSKVLVGPLVLQLDGEESRATAPIGSTIWLEGESHKPLKSVRINTENAADTVQVEFKEGDSKFVIKPKPLLRDDLRLKLEFEDQDGITASRTIAIILTPDKPPEFIKAQFEAVNRKFITNKAILPLSVAVRDDVGMLSLEYEVSLQKNDRTQVYQVRLPFRGYLALKPDVTQPGGMRFENMEDITLARVMSQLYSDSTGDAMQLLGTAARLPVTSGWLSLMQPLRLSLRKDYSQDYVDRKLEGSVIEEGDEYLDTLLLRTALNKPVTEPLMETPSRMVVRLVARDNRMGNTGPQHQESKTSESFEFNIVSEQDVLIEGGRREEDLRDRFEESIASLRKVRSSLKRVRDELDIPTPAKDDDVRRGMNDAQDATKSLAQIRGALDEKVLREFRQIYREFELNRVDERVLARIDGRICKPLAILLKSEQSFAKLEQAVDTLARRLESEGNSLPKNLLNEPVVQADRVLQKLEEILNDMRKLIEFNEALRLLRDLINNEQKLVDEMNKLIRDKLKNDLDDK